MKISKLLEIHSHENSGLQKCLGDSYLLKHNRIFRNIRKASNDYGFIFSHQNNEDYLALSLSQLENILTTKCIPYFDNVSALIKLEQKHPEIGHWNDIYENLRRNFHFHESCHAVARTLQSTEFKSLDDDILLRLIEESFANTCEMLAVIDCQRNSDRIFYEINSYTALFELKEIIEKLTHTLGLTKLFSLVLLGYLHSNHLHNSLKQNVLKDFLLLTATEKLVAENSKTSAQLKDLLQYCFYLDENFRQVATGFYIKLSTKNKSRGQLKEKNYLTILTEQNGYMKFIEKLSLIATKI